MNIDVSEASIFKELPGEQPVPKPKRGSGLESTDNCLFVHPAGIKTRTIDFA